MPPLRPAHQASSRQHPSSNGAGSNSAAGPSRSSSTSTTEARPAEHGGEGQARPPRKLNRSANQLHRNQACLPCRRRRIKCDAARPHCSSCVRSFRFLARTQPDPQRDAMGIQCTYEDGGDSVDGGDDASAEVEDPRAAVRKLEARIAELQGALDRVTPKSSSPRASSTLPDSSGITWVTQVASGTPGFPNVEPSSTVPPLSTAGGSIDTLLMNDISAVSGPSTSFIMGGLEEAPDDPSDPPRADFEAGKVGGPFLDIFWPGWPPRLPTPAMLDHLIQTFFSMVPSVSKIIHREKFLARLALPPTSPGFPHTALLHAICSVTARYSAAVRCCTVEESMRGTNLDLRGRRPTSVRTEEQAANEHCFAERHAQYAVLEMRLGSATGRRMLELAQAKVLMVVYYQQHAKWIEGWMMTGSAARLAVPLGLLSDSKTGVRTRNSILEAPTESWDVEEQRLLMAYIMTLDLNCSATSGWPNCLSMDEVMARLPASTEDFVTQVQMPENPQTWFSPDLYTVHPVKDGFVLMAKGVHLLGQVIKFKRKVQALGAPHSARNTPLFRKLDADIAAFHSHFPPSLRDPLRPGTGHFKGVDADLITAHLMPHVAAIALHESFADLADPRDSSAARILAEARACLSIVCLITSTTFDFSYILSPITSFYFFAAARTFVLFYQRALETGDYRGAKDFLGEIDVFRMTFAAMAHRFALGARHGGMIDQMLKGCHEELGIAPESVRVDGLGMADISTGEWMHLPYPYSDKTAGWHFAGTRRAETHKSPPESIVHPHHPLHLLFSEGRESFRDKMNQTRGFQDPHAGTPGSLPGHETPPLINFETCGPPAWQHVSAQPDDGMSSTS